MKNIDSYRIVIGLCFGLICFSTSAKESPKAVSETLIQSSTSWDGSDFSYPEGQPELTVSRINIPAGVTLPLHCHPVPLAGYITEGKLEVRKPSGETITITEGGPLIEVSNIWHQGHGVTDTEIIVVYAGSTDLPITILKDAEPELIRHCHD